MKKAKSFGNYTDTWFDRLTEVMKKTPSAYWWQKAKARECARLATKLSPSARSLDLIRRQLIAQTWGWAKRMVAHIEAVESNQFHGEFRRKYGPHSQTSELFSMIRQAVNYHSESKSANG